MAIKRRKKKIQELDRTRVKAIHADMIKALEEVGNKHKIIFKFGRVTYEPTFFSAKVTANVKGAETLEEITYKIHAKGLGLPPLGTKIRMATDTFILTGYNPRAPKKPILMKSTTSGKVFKTSIISVTTSPVV